MLDWQGKKKLENIEMDKILREHYPTLGPLGCMQFLPDKTRSQISRRANHIGLYVLVEHSGRHSNGTSIWETEGWDDIIREHYPSGGAHACSPFIPRRCVSISGRAYTLGLRMNIEDRTRIRGRCAILANETKEKRKQFPIGDITIDPFVSGPVPPSIFNRRLECEYYLQQ